VTWSDASDAPHTVSSDEAAGPLDGQLSPGGADYSQSFSKTGDYAYHCNIHPYMHAVVHVTALPPTDAAGSTTDAGGLGLLTLAAVAGLGLGTAGLFSFVVLRPEQRGSASRPADSFQYTRKELGVKRIRICTSHLKNSTRSERRSPAALDQLSLRARPRPGETGLLIGYEK